MAFHQCNSPMILGFLQTQLTPTLQPNLGWCMTCYRSCTNTLQLLQNSPKICSRCTLGLHQDLFVIRTITYFALTIKSCRSYWHSSGSLWTEEASRGYILQQMGKNIPDWFSTCMVWSEESLILSLSELCGTCITCTLHLRNSICTNPTSECGSYCSPQSQEGNFHVGLDHFLYGLHCVCGKIYYRSRMLFSWCTMSWYALRVSFYVSVLHRSKNSASVLRSCSIVYIECLGLLTKQYVSEWNQSNPHSQTFPLSSFWSHTTDYTQSYNTVQQFRLMSL